MYGALRALESLTQLLRRRALPPGSALAEAVPPEAVWPAEGEDDGEGQGGAGEQAPAPAPAGPAGRGRRKHRTALLVDQVDIYDSPRFRYR